MSASPKHSPDDNSNNNGKERVENTYKCKNYNSKIPSYPFWSKIIKTSDINIK